MLRVRLVTGGLLDVKYDDPDTNDEAKAVERAIATLAQDSGVLRTRHGGRLLVLYGRGVATVEVAPPGPVL